MRLNNQSARIRAFLLVVLFPFLFALGVVRASGNVNSDVASSTPGPTVVIRLDPQSRQRYIPPPASFSPDLSLAEGARQASIDVNFLGGGWTNEARQAFEFAAAIWESVLDSPVPIVVDAEFGPLPTGVLGGAGPTFVFRNFANAPQPNTWYASSAANRLANADLNPGTADIEAVFNSTFPDWHFGTGNSTPPGEISFTTVALHELGHGLGFSGSMRVDNGIGSVECNGVAGTGCFGYGGSPMIYDRFTENGAGSALIDFANVSTTLAGQLTSGNVYFDSPSYRTANPGQRIRLYAPANWQQGSSYSHVSQIYDNTPQALMTYSIARGETIHSPGSVALCMLKDMGWTVTSGCGETPVSGLAAQNSGPVLAGQLVHLSATIGGGGNVLYAWDYGDGQMGTGPDVEHRYDNPGFYMATVTASNSVNQQSASTFVQVRNAPFRSLAPAVLSD